MLGVGKGGFMETCFGENGPQSGESDCLLSQALGTLFRTVRRRPQKRKGKRLVALPSWPHRIACLSRECQGWDTCVGSECESQCEVTLGSGPGHSLGSRSWRPLQLPRGWGWGMWWGGTHRWASPVGGSAGGGSPKEKSQLQTPRLTALSTACVVKPFLFPFDLSPSRLWAWRALRKRRRASGSTTGGKLDNPQKGYPPLALP